MTTLVSNITIDDEFEALIPPLTEADIAGLERSLLVEGCRNRLVVWKGREHSRKPDEFYRLVEGLCPGTKVELFAREEREGWWSHGAERGLFSTEAGGE